MFAPTRILVPVDFSGASDAALRRASDLAERTGAELHVLYVVSGLGPDEDMPLDALPEEDRAFYHRLWARSEAELSAFLDRVAPAAGRAKRVLLFGPPSRVVLDYAGREGADLVVMGTHGRRGLRRFVLGSVAGAVLRRTEVPVMVVPGTTPGRKPLRRVLAPTDFSGASRWALCVAAGLAARYDADLDLLYALEPIRFAEGLTGVEIAAHLVTSLQDGAERRLQALAEDPGLVEAMADGVDAEVPVEARAPARIGYHVAEGRAAEAIVETARTLGSDVIVMAKQGLDGLERLLIGSVTERVCRIAPCAVLVIPLEEPDGAA